MLSTLVRFVVDVDKKKNGAWRKTERKWSQRGAGVGGEYQFEWR